MSTTAGTWQASTDEASGGTGKGASGDGDGRGGAGRRRRRRSLGESWDSVAGPRAEEPPEGAAEADERSVPRRAVEDAVGRSAGRLRACYQDGLRREPGLAGRIRVRFSVDPGGSVLVATDAGARRWPIPRSSAACSPSSPR